MKNILKPILFLCFAMVLVNCGGSDDDGNEMMDPDPDVSMNPIPDTTSTYDADVKMIIDTNCIGCHATTPTQGAPMSLVTFDNVVAAVNDRGLFGRISSTNELTVMPQSGRLPDATILIVEDWIADGLKQQ